MLTLIFVILLCTVLGKTLHLALKLAWGLTKILFSLILFPIVVIGLAIAGFMYLAILILIIAGVIAFVRGLVLG